MIISFNRKKSGLIYFLPLFVLSGLIYPFFSRAAGSNYFIPQGTVIMDDVYKTASRVEINGEIIGDLAVAAEDLKITGKISGDVLAISAKIVIEGEIGGNLRAIGNEIAINGRVGKNATIAANNFSLGETGQIDRNLYLMGGVARIQGVNPGKIWFLGDQMSVSGAKLSNLNLGLGQLSVDESATIAGSLSYQSDQPANIASGAAVNQVNWRKISNENSYQKYLAKYSTINYYFGRIITWFSWILLGLVIINLIVRLDLTVSSYIVFNVRKALIKGLIYFFIIPIFCLLLFATIIGMPLAIIIMALYLILLYLSQVFTSIALGFLIFKLYVKVRKVSGELSWIKKGNVLLLLTVGSFAQIVLISLPYIGRYLQVLIVLWGFGGIMAVGGFLFKDNKTVVKN